MDNIFYNAQAEALASEDGQLINRAFAFGDAVCCSFYIQNGQVLLAEASYFFLMASMRKMRMKIPMDFTLEYFENLCQNTINQAQMQQGVLRLMVYRKTSDFNQKIAKNEVDYVLEAIHFDQNIFALQNSVEMDIIKEINVNQNMMSNLQVHCPENIYAQIYAQDNDLDDVILLNPNRRMARSIHSNILLLQGKSIRTPKTAEGAYISPLMESFLAYIHQNALADIEPSELIAFETQKADEILLISESKGLHSVRKIRNQNFGNARFSGWVKAWEAEMLQEKAI